jgi:hypothetical protein
MDRERMALAMRVLSAICHSESPAEEDIAKLRGLAASEWERSLRPDELACLIIDRERRSAAVSAPAESDQEKVYGKLRIEENAAQSGRPAE